MSGYETTGSAFPGSTINMNSNLISISMGDTLSVTSGIANTITIGSKSTLTVGSQVSATLGPSSSYTWGSVMSVTHGQAWAWSGVSSTTSDATSRWGILNNTYHGGISVGSFALRYASDQQAKLITQAVLATYLVTIGLSLLGIQYPPFSMAKDGDGNLTGKVDVDHHNAWLTTVVDGVTVILLALAQYYLVKKLYDSRKCSPVATLGLAANGITSSVYSAPDTPATSPVATLNIKPGKETVPGAFNPSAVPYLGYVSDDTPIITLSASLFPATTSTSLTIKPNSTIISSATPTGETNGLSITSTDTELARNSGQISINITPVGTANSSELALGNNSAYLASSNNGAVAAVMMDPNSITLGVGNGDTAAKFTANNITIGGDQGLVMTSSNISIGGVLVVRGAPISPSVGARIRSIFS